MIFTRFTTDDIVLSELEQQLFPIFESTPVVSKTSNGWEYTKNSTYSDNATFTGSVYFANSSSFYVMYATASKAETEFYLPFESTMSTIHAPYNYETNDYDFYINNTKITEAIVISINPDNYKQGIDFDNFFLVMSGSSNNIAFTDKDGSGNYNVSSSLVLAPYYIKNSIDDYHTDGEFNSRDKYSFLTPAYELRTSTDNTFLTYNESSGEIVIDWTKGTVSEPMGIVYPECGLILLFPQLFNRAQITSIIRTSNKSLRSLQSLMAFGGYAESKLDKRLYFARLKAKAYNYSLNPSAYDIENGSKVYIEKLKDYPRTFITQVGLYNDQNECLAVGFFNKAKMKSMLTELPIKIELEL